MAWPGKKSKCMYYTDAGEQPMGRREGAGDGQKRSRVEQPNGGVVSA